MRFLTVLRPAGRQTRGATCTELTRVLGRIIANLEIETGSGASRCGGTLEMSMSCCMCEPMETAQSLGDDTHAVVTQPKVGTRARTSH